MLTPQFLLPVHTELVVDLFAGGGGASTGIELAIGRAVDLAVNHDPEAISVHTASPFGNSGDRIYVRETHAHHPQFAQMAFRADGEEFEDADGWLWGPKWTPAIHMKKEEARIWLEITGVRVERLQSISRADAIAEGIQFFNGDHECGAKNYMDKTDMDYSLCPIDSFETLWRSTGGDWAANPWVWVIDFKTISTTGRPA